MRNVLFENRWGALGFVGAIVLLALILVGDEDNEGVVGRAAGTVETQHEQMATDVAEVSRPVRSPPIVIPAEPEQFAADDDLVDDAAGFDPNPPDVEADHDPAPTVGPVVAAPDTGVMVPVDEGEIIGQ